MADGTETQAAASGGAMALPGARGSAEMRAARRDLFTAYGLMSPLLFVVAACLAVAIGSMVLTSFMVQENLTIIRTFSLQAYWEGITEPQYRALFLRSLGISATSTALCILVAFPVAYYVAFHGGSRKTIWIILIIIPFWTSYLLRVFAWKVILGYNGVINSGLRAMGMIEEPLEFLLYNKFAIVLTLTHAWLPFAVLPIFVALEKIDRSLLEAATDLGDGPVARFISITLPLSLPGVLAAAMMIFIPTVGDFVTPPLVGGPDGLMIANAIGENFGKSNDWPLGSALAIMSMVIVSLISLSILWASRRVKGGDA